MREPWFWRDLDPRSRAAAPMTRLLLTPLAALYTWAGQRRLAKAPPSFDPGVPVVCIGNLTLGGAGKTPVAAVVRDRLLATGRRTATLSRGYRGRQRGPLRVDALSHSASNVGDEPLMLAQSGEAWIAQDRAAGARAMAAAGVQVIVMDDGHQNPVLTKSLSVVAIDAGEPFGNGHVFPKGPLREPVATGLRRADAVVLMGDGPVPPAVTASAIPTFRARLVPRAPAPPGVYVAFAGIGRPQRFFDSLSQMDGLTLAEAVPFPDHHAYTASDLRFLETLTRERQAKLITTEKDAMRLPAEFRKQVATLPVTAAFDDLAALDALLVRAVAERSRS